MGRELFILLLFCLFKNGRELCREFWFVSSEKSKKLDAREQRLGNVAGRTGSVGDNVEWRADE